MLNQDLRSQSNSNIETSQSHRKPEADCVHALITGRRSVSRRNRASWYLGQLNKLVECDSIEDIRNDDRRQLEEESTEATDSVVDSHADAKIVTSRTTEGEPALEEPQDYAPEKDIYLVSMTTDGLSNGQADRQTSTPLDDEKFLITPNTRVLYLSKSVATSIVLDLSPSIVTVSPQTDCVYLDSMFDALKRALHLIVKAQEIPTSQSHRQQFVLEPKVFVTVIAYTPFVVAKNNQVLVQNRRISLANIDQVLVEIWLCLNRLTLEIHDLVTSTCEINLGYESTKTTCGTAFVFPQPNNVGYIRHPGSVLEDIYELGLFSAHLMPRLSRLSIIIITDGLFTSSNNMTIFRLRSVAVSFISLAAESIHPDGSFGYTPYIDLMKFVAKTTQGVYITHRDLFELTDSFSRSRQMPLVNNPLYKLFCWTLHSDMNINKDFDSTCCPETLNVASQMTSKSTSVVGIDPDHIARYFCVDRPIETIRMSSSNQQQQYNKTFTDPSLISVQNYHDWRSFKQLDRNLDADFEQVLSCLLREGYLIKSIHFKHRETTKIVARLVLHWKHNLDLEQELTAPYWNTTDPFEINESSNLILRPFNTPMYGDTYCEVIVHGSYSFLHNLYCDRKSKRKSDYREVAYRQFRQLIDGVMQTHDRLQYLSRFYRDQSLSKVPSYLLHGNSLLYEQPHTHKLTSTVDNVIDETKTSAFQEYWQKMSCLDTNSWKNLMHVHTLRLVLEHDQPKHKNIHCQNANGRYTNIQCRRALSAISNLIKSYASFALLEDSTYIKFIYNREDDLREIETSATKGFIVIQINKLLPIVVIYLMFTSGILDSHRVQIVSYLERQLVSCKLRNSRPSTVTQADNLLRLKSIHPSGESCCTLIRTPVERMLRVYSRSFIGEFLTQNLTLGLPGSYPFVPMNSQQHQQPPSLKMPNANGTNGKSATSGANSHTTNKRGNSTPVQNHYSDNRISGNSIDRYNLVFGKYLYGVRVVHTVGRLPHELVNLIATNVLSKISAILVNIRIKQGFHIAFNNSGILNLVVELAMKDHSHEFHTSSCLCQYLVFPAAITSSASAQSSLNTSSAAAATTAAPLAITSTAGSQVVGSAGTASSSKPNSLIGSFGGNSDHSYMVRNDQDGHTSAPTLRPDNGEVKVIREYWIEQQYGVSCEATPINTDEDATGYHESLQNLRYSQVVDHLFLTDSTIFDCLLTYDLLQLLCDKLSPFYELDTVLAPTSNPNNQILSPTSSLSTPTSSSSTVLDSKGRCLPSDLIDGNQKDGNTKIPLLEFDYEFSVVKFLDCCQQASLNVPLFRDKSEFYENIVEDLEQTVERKKHDGQATHNDAQPLASKQHHLSMTASGVSRKMSVDVGNPDREHSRREHRSSYDNLNSSSNYFINPLYSPSLNHLFLETLHKRLKQMHDKEYRLSESDQKRMSTYLLKRKILHEFGVDTQLVDGDDDDEVEVEKNSTTEEAKQSSANNPVECINWRCFLRKGNQDNLMIVLLPTTLGDIVKWMNLVENYSCKQPAKTSKNEPVCPIFVFRCSGSMINDYILSFLSTENTNHNPTSDRSSPITPVTIKPSRTKLEADLTLHFGQPCFYMGQLKTTNDELDNEIIPLSNRWGILNQSASDEKTLEIVHFRAFLRKVKNTVLKSRFSSLNDAYLSEIFVHKDDVLYYINNIDLETQKKYHVSTQLKSLAEFIKSYQEYVDSLPKEPVKQCNPLLNSILLQKCGLFINQPVARFNEANPLMKQLHDRKLLYLMRLNFKIELPILEESLTNSTMLKSFFRPTMIQQTGGSSYQLQSSINEHLLAANSPTTINGNSSNMSTRFGSPTVTIFSPLDRFKLPQQSSIHPTHHHMATRSSNPNLLLNPANDNFILEAFRDSSCPMRDVSSLLVSEPTPRASSSSSNIAQMEKQIDDISLRHETHMAEVLRRKAERKESHLYRRVLKSKLQYNQSHSAIDQALRRVDSLGRLEHFCLTPLLFSPSWRSKLAPVRDHTIEAGEELHTESTDGEATKPSGEDCDDDNQKSSSSSLKSFQVRTQQQQQEADERWHRMVCNSYIKEYEQYIQTLGFNSVQIRYPSRGSVYQNQFTPTAASKSESRKSSKSFLTTSTSGAARQQSNPDQLRKDSSIIAAAGTTAAANQPISSDETGYLIKFLNSGCLVFKVGFCKPYVYSILYSIEGERFNNSNLKMNMAAFLDELDNIKVTMHLHSFTYDYHLRSIYSYISGNRQMTFSPGYHLISFVDDFRKYYQKAPNYARNQILGGEICVTNIRVTGQQLYNYIVTHNSAYNLEVLEMTSTITKQILSLLSTASNKTQGIPGQRTFDLDKLRQSINNKVDVDAQAINNSSHSHANDYVLIELKREKVRYRDGKDPDIFDCGLLITHDVQQTNGLNMELGESGSSKQTTAGTNCLVLKYFLLLTNQRDLYPKLVHRDESIIDLGCHRPIRLAATQLIGQAAQVVESSSEIDADENIRQRNNNQVPSVSTITTTSPLDHGEPSVDRVATSDGTYESSVQSTASETTSGQQKIVLAGGHSKLEAERGYIALDEDTLTASNQSAETEEATDALDETAKKNIAGTKTPTTDQRSTQSRQSEHSDIVPAVHSSQQTLTEGNNSKTNQAICDEEITYLGYFSSDEMDMLQFLQEKTKNLRTHITEIVRLAEIHYRRDYLWQKLMQRNEMTGGSKPSASDQQLPLSIDELLELLQIVQAIDLAALDPQLANFTVLNINWYMKLLKAFSDFKQSNVNQHRIFTIKVSKNLLLFIDPKCTTALILLSIDMERGQVEMNMLLKDQQECSKIVEKLSPTAGQANNGKSSSLLRGDSSEASSLLSGIELDQDCQQLINDFINFCATFMWSTFLT